MGTPPARRLSGSSTWPARMPLVAEVGVTGAAAGAAGAAAGASARAPRNGAPPPPAWEFFLPNRLQPVSPRQTASKPTPTPMRTAGALDSGRPRGSRRPVPVPRRDRAGPEALLLTGRTASRAILPAPRPRVKADRPPRRAGAPGGLRRRGTTGKVVRIGAGSAGVGVSLPRQGRFGSALARARRRQYRA